MFGECITKEILYSLPHRQQVARASRASVLSRS